MYAELAAGIDDPLDVARRYGISDSEYVTLVGQKWFIALLATHKRMLEEGGFDYKAKMAFFAEAAATEAYKRALESDSASLMLDAAKFYAKVAGLEPRPQQNALATPGSGFQVIINIPERGDKPAQTIEAESVSLEVEDKSELPPKPEYVTFSMPGFDIGEINEN
jgi:hypothetical protein